MYNPWRKNLVISFEGNDKAGKTSQIKIIALWLRKKYNDRINKIKIIHFPDRTTRLGKLINSFLLGTLYFSPQVLQLLYVANRYEKFKMMIDFLEDTKIYKCINILLIDRYIDSGIAYGVARGLELEYCSSLEEYLPVPDLVIYLDSDISSLPLRKSVDKDFETDENSENIFLKNKKYFTEQMPGLGLMFTIPKDLSIEQTSFRIQFALENIFTFNIHYFGNPEHVIIDDAYVDNYTRK